MRESSEIATCLRLYLLSLSSNVEHVILYSDACTGQNRNQIIASALLHTVTHCPNIKIIDHKFLESGHTHMECDSIHAAIEFAKKKTQIFVPSQWDTVITMARRRDPYQVIPLRYKDFLDFIGVRNSQIKVQNNARVKVHIPILILFRKMHLFRRYTVAVNINIYAINKLSNVYVMFIRPKLLYIYKHFSMNLITI